MKANTSINYNNTNSLTIQQSYNQLLNHRTTLLHMQFLYSRLQQQLSNQHCNHQNQHKDRLIQCFNLKQELEELKSNNMMKLFIVKLEELLAIEELCNRKLIEQPALQSNQMAQGQKPQKQQQQQQQHQSHLPQQYTTNSIIDNFLTFKDINQHQMQQSLCKLYLGNKVMLDLEKTAESLLAIERKIDQFVEKNVGVMRLYNERIQELEAVRTQCDSYVKMVGERLGMEDTIGGNANDRKDNAPTDTINSTSTKNRTNSFNLFPAYSRHIQHKLKHEHQRIQQRIQTLKHSLLQFL